MLESIKKMVTNKKQVKKLRELFLKEVDKNIELNKQIASMEEYLSTANEMYESWKEVCKELEEENANLKKHISILNEELELLRMESLQHAVNDYMENQFDEDTKYFEEKGEL